MTSSLTSPPPGPPELGCPSCGRTLAPGTRLCPSCGLGLTGPAAAELWRTDQQLLVLQRHRRELVDWLRRHPPVDAPPATQPVATTGQQRSWSGQQVLLATGALLVVTAAVVFLAVAWSVLGVAGQVAVMALLTVAAGAASLTLSSRRLTATAETLGAVAVGLAVVDLAAAHTLDLAGLRAVDAAWYATATSALLAAGCGVVSWRRPSPVSFALAAVLAGAAVPLLGTVAAEPSGATVALVFLLATAAAMLLARALGSRRLVRVSLLVVAAGYLLATWLVAVATTLQEPLLGPGGLAAGVSLVAAGAVAVWAGLPNGIGRVRFPEWGYLALVVAVLTVTALAWHLDGSGATTAAVALVAAGVAAAAAAAVRRPLAARPIGVALLGLHLLAATALVVAEGSYLDGTPLERSPLGWTVAGALLVTAVAAAVLARRGGWLHPVGLGYTTLLVLVAAAQLAGPSGVRPTVVVLLVLAVLAAALAAVYRGRADEAVLAGAWGVAWVAACGVSALAASPAPLAAAALATAGLTSAASALLPRRGWLAVLGALLCSASVWTLLLDREIDTVEAYTLPLALMLGVLGLVRWRRDPNASSWLTVGSALSIGLLPSAAASIDDGELTRPLLVLATGAAALLLGVARGWQSPVLIGGLALAVVAASQLAPWAVGLPRWLSFGSVGLLLLVLGARYEERRRNARSAMAWVAALH